MFVSVGGNIEDQAIKNLLSAHRRMADSGNATEIIRLTKYILKIAGKRKDMLMSVMSEVQTRQEDKPVDIKLKVGEQEIVKAWSDETEIRLT